MGNEQYGDIFFLKPSDQIKENFNLKLGQYRGGFIHDQYVRLMDQGLGNFNHLLFRHTQVFDQGIRGKLGL